MGPRHRDRWENISESVSGISLDLYRLTSVPAVYPDISKVRESKWRSCGDSWNGSYLVIVTGMGCAGRADDDTVQYCSVAVPRTSTL